MNGCRMDSALYSFSHTRSQVASQGYMIHAHPFYELYYFVRGEVDYLLSGVERQLRPGTMLVILPNEFHGVRVHSAAVYERWTLHFDPDMLGVERRDLLLEAAEGDPALRFLEDAGAWGLEETFAGFDSLAGVEEGLQRKLIPLFTEALLPGQAAVIPVGRPSKVLDIVPVKAGIVPEPRRFRRLGGRQPIDQQLLGIGNPLVREVFHHGGAHGPAENHVQVALGNKIFFRQAVQGDALGKVFVQVCRHLLDHVGRPGIGPGRQGQVAPVHQQPPQQRLGKQRDQFPLEPLLHPHQLDLWQWICGMPVSVLSQMRFGQWHDIEVEDDVTTYVEYANGATGVFVTTTGDAHGTNRFEIQMDRAKLVVEDGQLHVLEFEVSEPEWSRTNKAPFATMPAHEVAVETDGKNEQHVGVINAWGGAILRGTPLVAHGSEGIYGLTLSNAMHLSAFLGKKVELPLDEDLFYTELMKRVATSRRKADTQAVFADTSSTYGGNR